MTPKVLRWGFSCGFVLLILVLLGVVGLAMHRTSDMNSRIREILEGRFAKVQLASDAVRYSSRNNRITMQVFLVKRTQDTPALLAERAKNSDTISELLRQIELNVESDAEKKLFDKVWATRKPYVDSYKEALGLLLDHNDYEKARAKMVGVTLPRIIDYHEAWEQFVQFQSEQMRKAGLEGKAEVKLGQERILFLVGTGVLLTIGLWIGVVVVLGKQARGVTTRTEPMQESRGQGI